MQDCEQSWLEWCGLAQHSDNFAVRALVQVAPAEHGYELLSEASSESSEPSIFLGCSYDSSSPSTCRLMLADCGR